MQIAWRATVQSKTDKDRMKTVGMSQTHRLFGCICSTWGVTKCSLKFPESDSKSTVRKELKSRRRSPFYEYC